MKKLILLFTTYLLLLSCSSDDNNTQNNIQAIPYQHLVIFVSNDTGGSNGEASIAVKVNHTYAAGNQIEETTTFTNILDELILVLDNANNPLFTITNNGPTDVIVQFESKRGDGNGGFIQINEANDFFTFETNSTKSIIYNYEQETYQEQ